MLEAKRAAGQAQQQQQHQQPQGQGPTGMEITANSNSLGGGGGLVGGGGHMLLQRNGSDLSNNRSHSRPPAVNSGHALMHRSSSVSAYNNSVSSSRTSRVASAQSFATEISGSSTNGNKSMGNLQRDMVDRQASMGRRVQGNFNWWREIFPLNVIKNAIYCPKIVL